MHLNLLYLSKISNILGLIGLAEFKERVEVAEWLLDSGGTVRDPRLGSGEKPEAHESSEGEQPDFAEGLKRDVPADRWFHLVALSKWVFTVGDADCYPSVPNGHIEKENQFLAKAKSLHRPSVLSSS